MPTAGDYCLECGARLPRRASGDAVLAERFADRPGRAAFALLLVAAAGALVALAVTRDGGGKTTLVATGLPPRTVVHRAPVLALPTAPEATLPPVTTSAPPPAVAPTPGSLTRWTPNDAFTVVLASLPTSAGRATAIQLAKHALTKGLGQVGVLESRKFSSLAPGFIVVFSGVYDSFDAASAQVSAAEEAGFQLAYARQITR